tara:strand:- start:2007 stop:2162 length:156 start_codon:yes stop_codon:yes gene_type:complete
MAKTPLNPFPFSSKAPDFKLPDTVSDKELSLNEVKGSNGTVAFIYVTIALM